MKTIKIFSFGLALVFFTLIAPAVWAKRFSPVPLPDPLQFDTLYEKLIADQNELTQQLTPAVIKKIGKKQEGGGKNQGRLKLSSQQNILADQYKKNQEALRLYSEIDGFRDSLNEIYLKQNHIDDATFQRLNNESTRLAIGLFAETKRLKEKYRSIFMPIVHNMMIDIGVRKRGACKHWAEDLLEYLRMQKREFFYVTWGEANPGKMTEHNVAVLYPVTGGFYDGVFIDPWRTSGIPFWLSTTKDKHYHWNPWDYYGVF